ncbi:protein kinase family protein [Aspergillus lucknowensis]|uniref:Kinase-like domain-containing protein n=1 Tax=Aspergillus lucknowensis TaxID=176173 RepID=A0ABR4M0L6_9EURO
MASNRYESLHNEIYQEISSKLERKDRESLRFAPVGTAEQVLHPDKLRRFFRSLFEPGHPALNLFADKFVTRVNERAFHRFIAVSILAGCSVTAVRAAVVKLVANDTWPIPVTGRSSICSLPIRREDHSVIFDRNETAADQFLGKQAYFCPVVIREKEEVRIDDPDYQRLPYLEEQMMGKGSFGHVYKVKIAAGHFYNSKDKTAILEPREFARKDYELTRQFNAAGEREIMERIIASSAWECPNILKNLGSLAFGTTVYSLFMPLAICDLRAYMMEHHQARPNSLDERKDLIRCAMGLAGGLDFLHNEMKTSEMDELVCYHMDLKPSNILIFSEEDRQDGQVRNIWKLSDFGMSRIKFKRSGEGVDREKDFDSWFVRRSKPHDPSASATRNERGDGTYLAPESTSSGRRMRASSDVWSLGCVLSVLFSYMEAGAEGVMQYATERASHYDAVGCDTFFVPSRHFRPARVNPVLKKTHKQLIQDASQRSLREGEIVSFALKYIEDYVLQVDQSQRSGAKQVKVMLESTFKSYQKITEGPSPPPPPAPGFFHDRILQDGLNRIISVRGNSSDDRNVDSWYLSDVESAKGCQISPDCSRIAYWTDDKIFLYSADSQLPAAGSVIESAAEYTREEGGGTFYWRSIRLTRQYLVASTTQSSFHCYIFNIDQGNLDHRYVVALPRPAISKFAISTDSRTLACVLRASEDPRKSGSLFVAPIEELIRPESRMWLTRERSLPVGLSDTPHTTSPTTSIANCWRKYALSWPAEDVTKLSFSTAVDIFFLAQPELTTQTTKHKIPVVHINLRSREQHVVYIESRGLDSATRLLTTFAPFHHELATCAVVTQERQLYIHNMAAEADTAPVRKDIKNYRLIKLMVGEKDDRMFAMARKSANHRMMLLEMKVPQHRSDELSIRELAYLPDLTEDDRFTERLCEVDGESSVLIAALVGRDRRSVYRVGVDGARMMTLWE